MTFCVSFVLFLEHQTRIEHEKGDPPVGSVPPSSWPSTVPRYRNVNLVAFLAPKPLGVRNAARRKLCLPTDDYGQQTYGPKEIKATSNGHSCKSEEDTPSSPCRAGRELSRPCPEVCDA